MLNKPFKELKFQKSEEWNEYNDKGDIIHTIKTI